MTISNNKISHLVSSQLPFFVRNDHATFARFIEAYYEYLEQEEKAVNFAKNLNTYQNVDLTIDDFAEHLYATFLKLIPENTIADKNIILKHAKDFYRSRGSEKSIRFLMRILFDEEIELYYPKKDILRFSDGKWFIQKSLRITDTKIEDTFDASVAALENYIGTRIVGQTSNSSALVERVDRFYVQGAQIDELILSNIDGDFRNGETIATQYNDVESIRSISSNIFSGVLSTVVINNAGNNYEVGDPVIILSNTGAGACVTVAEVSSGNVSAVTVLDTGAGYRVDDLIISLGGGGTGFNAIVFGVSSNNYHHPNTYNIINSTIQLEQGTPINNAVYSNLNSANLDTTIANGCYHWVYANTGPLESVLVINAGNNYTSQPTLSIVGNTAIRGLGIIGKLDINNGGQNYALGDVVTFTNVPGGFGFGALANVTGLGPSNSIAHIQFVEVPGQIIGGSGYDYFNLPNVAVSSVGGTGANITVSELVNYGAQIAPINTGLGQIQRIIISSSGAGYEDDTTADLTGSGDGEATATVTILEGTYTYPGRYLNDDGHLSSYNFLQNRDYYQNFSYVVKVRKSVNQYKQAMKELIHPAGMKMFGEYRYIEQNSSSAPENNTETPWRVIFLPKTFEKEANTVNISFTSHGVAANTNVYLEYHVSDYANVVNGIYMVTVSSTNYFQVQQTSNTGNASGTVDVGIMQA